MMQVIQTHYRGYHFRSRLEARWAVFFDALRIPWQYEVEGFDLGAAGWYLPDFWLPQQRYYVEIKGERSSAPDTTKARAWVLATKQPIWVFLGLPNYDPELDWISTGFRTDGSRYEFVPDDPEVSLIPHMLEDPDEYGGIAKVRAYIKNGGTIFDLRQPTFEVLGFTCSNAQYIAAVIAARSARFEHGEAWQLSDVLRQTRPDHSTG